MSLLSWGDLSPFPAAAVGGRSVSCPPELPETDESPDRPPRCRPAGRGPRIPPPVRGGAGIRGFAVVTVMILISSVAQGVPPREGLSGHCPTALSPSSVVTAGTA